MRCDQGKDAKNALRTGEQRSFRNIDAAVLDHEVGARNGNPLAPLRPVERLPCRRQSLHGQDRAAIDRARMTVVGPHPVGGVGSALGFEPDTLRRRFILRMPIEAVVVAAAAQVEKTARGAEKLKRRRGVVVHRIE